MNFVRSFLVALTRNEFGELDGCVRTLRELVHLDLPQILARIAFIKRCNFRTLKTKQIKYTIDNRTTFNRGDSKTPLSLCFGLIVKCSTGNYKV